MTTAKERTRELMAAYEAQELPSLRPTIDLGRVPESQREEAARILEALDETLKANPLNFFDPHPANKDGYRFQLEFLAATTKIVAAFCGNQAGKSTIGMVKALIQLLPRQMVPDHLRLFKQFEAPCHGWVLCETEDKIFDTLLPIIDKWCPKAALLGGSRRKAFNGERMQLSFADGSTLTFKTYKQDTGALTGATLHFVLYDEPPPQAHRDEAATRLLLHDGPEWYAMTPLKSHTGWIRREVWRKREDPEITVVKGSMRDNPLLTEAAITRKLASYKNDIWRRAREFGDFMDISGLVYPQMELRVVNVDREPDGEGGWRGTLKWREFVKTLDLVVGIDPGIRNAAFIFGGFDDKGVDWIFDEHLIQDGTPSQYAVGIDEVLLRWDLHRDDVMFVIDPAARQRSQATGDTVQSELTRVGIYTVNGVRDRETGQQQIRDRLLHDRLRIFDHCYGLRDEADEFSYEMDEEDGIGPADDSPFHRLATLRYQVMTRPFYPQREEAAAERNLGWRPGVAPRLPSRAPVPVGPLGPLQ